MKNIIRKLSLKKFNKNSYGDKERLKQYVVVYRYDYDVVNEETLKDMLLNPKREIKFIFQWSDQLNISTKFEELGEDGSNE